jgi:hypothetical protein
MKKVIIFLLVSVCFCNCSGEKETIDFITLNETEFNAKPFELPDGIPDSLKRAHDSCMGFTFDVNAIFYQTKDTFFIGSIINKQSLMIVNTVNDLGLTQAQLISKFNVLTNPCYEKRVLQFPLKSILGENFSLQLPGANEALNKEIDNAISAADDAEMQTGSWVYLDMRDALKNIMDTTKSAAGLRYKENLLDTANMILTAMESVTDVSFIINTRKDMSEPLLALLKTKPSALRQHSQATLKLAYIDNNRFEMSLNGFFPIVGQFMKATLK